MIFGKNRCPEQMDRLIDIVGMLDDLHPDEIVTLGKACRLNSQDMALPSGRREIYKHLAALLKKLK